MKVIIPLAGKGSRMRPHTHTKPKPLLPVAGKPVIDHIIDSLASLDVTEYIFVTGHLKTQVEAHIRETYDFPMRFVEQKVINGSAGAFQMLKEYIDGPVFIVFADTIFDADLSEINTTQEDGLIWTMEVEDYSRFGVIVHDAEGTITDMVEKPQEPISKLANVGMYYVKNTALMFEKIDALFAQAPNEEQDFPDALRDMVYAGEKFKIRQISGWHDTGKPETTLITNATLLARNHTVNSDVENTVINEPVFIGKNCSITNSVIGPNVTLMPGCAVNNAILRDSIIDQNSTVEDITLVDSILGAETVLEGTHKDKKATVMLGDHSTTKLH